MRLHLTHEVREEQTTLWPWVGDRALDNPSVKRHYLGHFLEDVIAETFGAAKIIIDNRSDICPDLQLASGDYAEVKGCSTEAIVFQHRIDNDVRFQEVSGKTVWYIYVMHEIRFDSLTNLHGIPAIALPGIRSIHVVATSVLVGACPEAKKANLTYRQIDDSRMPAWRFRKAVVKRLAGDDRRDVTLRYRGADGPVVPVYGDDLNLVIA